jgi:hypothetical protein
MNLLGEVDVGKFGPSPGIMSDKVGMSGDAHKLPNELLGYVGDCRGLI